MKSYSEMARNVLERAQVEVRRRKKARAAISFAVVGCMAAVMVCVFVGGDTAVTPPVGGDTSVVAPSGDKDAPMVTESFLQAVCYSDGEISATALEPNVRMQFYLEVTDVRGKSEAEVEQLREEQVRSLARMERAWTQDGYAYRVSYAYRENALVVYASTGGFCLDVEDWSKVKEISGRCDSEYGKVQCAVNASAPAQKSITYRWTDEDGTEHLAEKPVYRHGNCWIYGQNIVIPGESLSRVYEEVQDGRGSLLFSWEPTQALFDAIENDVGFELPEIAFSFTLCYEDGTEVTHTFTAESYDGAWYITCVK